MKNIKRRGIASRRAVKSGLMSSDDAQDWDKFEEFCGDLCYSVIKLTKQKMKQYGADYEDAVDALSRLEPEDPSGYMSFISNSRRAVKSGYSDTDGAEYKAKSVVRQMVKQFGYDSTKQAFDSALSTIKSHRSIKSAPQRVTLNPEEMMRYDEDDYRGGSTRPFDKMLKRAADADIAEEKELERQELLKKYEDVTTLLDSGKKPEDIMSDLFEKLVPAQGSAETVAGEMVRACMRVMYRLYNDGDCFLTGERPGDGMGAATVVPSLQYLCEKIPSLDSQIQKMIEHYPQYVKVDYNYSGGRYYSKVNTTEAYKTWVNDTLPSLVIETLKNNPGLFGEKNTEDGRFSDYDPREWAPCDLDFEMNASLDGMLDGCSERDVKSSIESDIDWMTFLSRDVDISVDVDEDDYGVSATVNLYELTINQLSSCYEELGDRWLKDELQNFVTEREEDDEDYDEDDE